MCGIALLISKGHRFSLVDTIESMAALIQHRGPDDQGVVLFSEQFQPLLPGQGSPAIALAHKRLSIVEKGPAGHQPMASPDQRFWISYNGEIYNHQEIRQELEAQGIVFASQTDTEVVLYAYQRWGLAAFARFNGMFAFVICDCVAKKILAVRDHFGIKPLYYWQAPDGTVAIASEIKQFSPIPGWQPQLNPQSIYDFLNWGLLDHTPETCFKQVRQLQGGEYLYFSLEDDKTIQIRRWYHLTTQSFQGSYAEACQQFLHLLQSSVQMRLHQELESAACLSGGLDSSSIITLLQRCQVTTRPKLSTFSVCSSVPRFDESRFIQTIVQSVDAQAFYIYPEWNQWDQDSKELLWHQDEPIGSASIFAQWLLCKQIKAKKIRVLLDGQGADEYLAGYHGFFGHRFYELFSTLQWRQLLHEMRLCRSLHTALSPLALLLSKALPDPLRQPLKKMAGRAAIRPIWLDHQRLQADDRDPFASDRPTHTVAEQSCQQLLRTSLPMLLHWADRNSMAQSVEARTPFLDHRLVEFCLGLPSEYKIMGGWTKRVLRDSMQGILPETIRTRTDKMGFVTAEEEWMRQNPAHFRNQLQHAIERSGGILKPAANQVLADMIAGKRPYSHLPWRMISFGQWLDRFDVSCV